MNVGFVALNRANTVVLTENRVIGDKSVINSGVWQICILKHRKLHRRSKQGLHQTEIFPSGLQHEKWLRSNIKYGVICVV